MKQKLAKVIAVVLAALMLFSFAACDTGKQEEETKKKITLSATTLELTEGEEQALTATAEPADMQITWSSDNETVAVYEDGKVKAIAAGTAKITAQGDGVSAVCTVTVKAEEPEVQPGVTVNPTSMSLEVGKTRALSATTVPAGSAVTWTSDNEEVATFADGWVTAVAVGTANIKASITVDDEIYSATCKVTVTEKQDAIENGINKTQVAASELKTLEGKQSFESGVGEFTLGTGAEYDATAKGIKLADQGYMYVKVQLPEFTNRYQLTEGRANTATNSDWFVRFEAPVGTGGAQVYVVSEDEEMLAVGEAVMFDRESGKYQVKLDSTFSKMVLGIVIQNPAPEGSSTQSVITSFEIVQEKDPLNRAEYLADMYAWLPAANVGFEPSTFSPTQGWGNWHGISRGDLSHNCLVYLDSFGAALEYDNQGDKNLENEGVAIYAKLLIPEGTKKLEYFAGYINETSAYRIQLYDGTDLINLTSSSSKINTANVKPDEGWTVTAQAYSDSELSEVAIPAEYIGEEVIIIFSAKFNNGSSFGMRFNNIKFSSQDLIVPPTVSEGVNIDTIKAQEVISASEYSFAESLSGFAAQWGAAHDADKDAIAFTGTSVPEGATANAAVTANLTVPAGFKYLRITVAGEAGKSVDIRVRMVDLESNTSATLLDWKTVTGAEDQILQIQSFPTTFIGTVGFIVESKYTDPSAAAALYVKNITFANANRDENGYDLDAMNYILSQPMPQDNKFVFDAANCGKWSVFTANDDSNTKCMNNNIWMQLQSTAACTEFSALIAYRTTLGSFTSVNVKSLAIENADIALTSMMRVRALKSDGTFVNFTKDGLTDANGWYDGSYNEGRGDTVIEDLGFGKTIEKTLDVPAELANQDVVIIIEFNNSVSSNWNVLIEHLEFNA